LVIDNIKQFFVATCLLLAAASAHAGQAHVAVASNFVPALELVAKKFEAGSGHRLTVSSGSSGKLYAQIKNGAPFDVLLSADAERPQKLEAEQMAVPGSRFTYALGRLALWSLQASMVDGEGRVLKQGQFKHLAIANPKTAPYGEAAQEALRKMGVWDGLQARLVQGEDIGQTFQFVASGNAELGLVSLAQVKAAQGKFQGSYWVVPQALHQPIAQQAVLLAKGRNNPAARAFMEFLKGKEARAVIESFGYGLQ
jgi:molybdate transport system substrate-binding protein